MIMNSQTYDDEKVLSAVLDAKDSWERHINSFKQFWIDHAGKITQRIEKRVSGELDGM